MGSRVAVAGLFSLPIGLGRGATLLRDSLERDGIPTFRIDLTRVLNQMHRCTEGSAVETFEPKELEQLNVSDLVIHVNPPQFIRALRSFHPQQLSACTLVGMWLWELELVPPYWKHSAACCDEIWSPSPFIDQALRSGFKDFSGIYQIRPYAGGTRSAAPPTPQERARARSTVGISRDTYVVGQSFSMASSFSRKNPLAAIEAFQRSFDRSDHLVKLIIRCQDKHLYPYGHNELRHAAARDPRIMIVDDQSTLPIDKFYSVIDTYLGLFRSEGYGLNLVEAADSGIPVIATRYGLAPEIVARHEIYMVDYTLIPVHDPQGIYAVGKGAKWADANIAEASRLLRKLRERFSLRL